MPKILVADDNTNIQKMVSLALEERGINVISVGNGEAAVRRLPDLNPDLVLADIFMPARNGYEVCEFMKKDERFAHVPVILLVGAFDPLDEKEARRVGADGILKKPFVPPDPLIAMVTSTLEKNPRIAAELAKAKEPKATPEPEPIPNIGLSARPGPKPLPDFPEPSAEEAALVYGFGTANRDDDKNEARAPVADSNAQAPENEQEDASAQEWNHSITDFEIPADVANAPAMPSSDFDAISFPSEKDYPPRRVSVSYADEERQAATQSGARLDDPPAFSLRKTPELNSRPENASEPIALPEPNSTATGGHWLDAIVPPVENGVASKDRPGWAGEPENEPATGLPIAFAPAQSQGLDDASQEQSFFADDPAVQDISAAAEDGESDLGFYAAAPAIAPTGVESGDSESLSPASENQEILESTVDRAAMEPLPVETEATVPKRDSAPAEDAGPRSSISALPINAAPMGAQGFLSDEEAAPDPGNDSPQSINEDSEQRIPTMPPPNREALAGIPFLTPPPSFSAEWASRNSQASPTADAGTVDAVVQKVLEKLEPQLHELLSQGLLKPLVENLLQNELAKKR